jgi:hypothetical protein
MLPVIITLILREYLQSLSNRYADTLMERKRSMSVVCSPLSVATKQGIEVRGWGLGRPHANGRRAPGLNKTFAPTVPPSVYVPEWSYPS